MEIYSFEGLNRCGKGTVTQNLRNHFKANNIPVEVLRGDGSRPGIGSYEYHDPYNEYWLKWQKNKNKSNDDWDSAYDLLSRESYYRAQQFEKESNGKGIILMDRSHFSRWFVLRQRDRNASLDQTLSINTIVPDKYFIFNVNKDILLRRAENDKSRKSKFRKEIINSQYNLWNNTIQLNPLSNDKVVYVNGEKSINSVFDYVLSIINTK